MKKNITSFIVLFALSLCAHSQQVSLFDQKGEAVAYIDYNKDATVFLFDGTPAAFLEKNGIVGFNREFLGWYEDGIVYDRNGKVVGCKKEALSMYYKIERMKSIQRLAPIRPMTPIAPMMPIRSSIWNSMLLSDWLLKGK